MKFRCKIEHMDFVSDGVQGIIFPLGYRHGAWSYTIDEYSTYYYIHVADEYIRCMSPKQQATLAYWVLINDGETIETPKPTKN
jgi:hypothetical protein